VEDSIARIEKSSTKKDLIIGYNTKEDKIIAEVDKEELPGSFLI
jgi:hypothetical protein